MILSAMSLKVFPLLKRFLARNAIVAIITMNRPVIILFIRYEASLNLCHSRVELKFDQIALYKRKLKYTDWSLDKP